VGFTTGELGATAQEVLLHVVLDQALAVPLVEPYSAPGREAPTLGRRQRGVLAEAHAEAIIVEHQLVDGEPQPGRLQIGRASCRESVCQYVSLAVVAVSLK